MTIPPDHSADPQAWLHSHQQDLIAQLIGWVRIRSVVGPPEHEIDLIRSANWLAGVLREIGFPTVELWSTDSGPAVWAEWCDTPDAPTVLIYSHHDVRAAKDEQWQQCPPFEPALRDGRLFGRGTSDAKGQVLAHVWALRSLLATGHEKPPINLKFLVEGEEQPDLREIDKPKNGIVRLPKVIVQEQKPAVFSERAIHTQKGLTDIAMRRYISDADRALNAFTLPLFGTSKESRAMAMYLEDERLKNMSELEDNAITASKSDAAAGKVRRES